MTKDVGSAARVTHDAVRNNNLAYAYLLPSTLLVACKLLRLENKVKGGLIFSEG